MTKNNTLPMVISPPSRRLTRDEYITYLMGVDYQGSGMNCWYLVQDFQKYVYGVSVAAVLEVDKGITVPGSRERAYLFNKHPERRKWQRVITPRDGAIILTARKTTPPDFYQHAGVYVDIDDGCIVHYDEGHGVALDPVWMFKEFRRWNEPHYFVRRKHL